MSFLVGYVDGKEYYGPFHIHPSNGRKMVGIIHSSTKHKFIYDTKEESLGSTSYNTETGGSVSNATTTDSVDTPTATPSPTPDPEPTPTPTSNSHHTTDKWKWWSRWIPPQHLHPLPHHHHQLLLHPLVVAADMADTNKYHKRGIHVP